MTPLFSLRGAAAGVHLILLNLELGMTTLTVRGDLLPTTSQLPSSANLRANPRMSLRGVALAGDLITTVPGVFREADFLDRLRLGEGLQPQWPTSVFSDSVS